MNIWLVWRTNVGKSTIFNRMIGTWRAIVTDVEWTTRELLVEDMHIWPYYATLTDSPWLEDFDEEMQFIDQIIRTSDLLVFVVDTRREISVQDQEIQQRIIKAGKMNRTVLAVNKCDGQYAIKTQDEMIGNWFSLWFERNVWISAQHDEWFFEMQQELLELATTHNLDRQEETPEDTSIPIAIIWRPNSGKSTLINTLVWEEIAHVQDKAWTTLDYISGTFKMAWQEYTVYDTAGIRKKWKILWLEKIAHSKTMTLLDHTRPIVIYILDIAEWLTHRDLTLLWEITEKWLPLIVLVNKIDKFTPEEMDLKIKHLGISKLFPRVIIKKISALEWIGIPQAVKSVNKVRNTIQERIPTNDLNKVLQKEWLTRPPRFPKNNICKRKYITQVETFPPTFSLSVNNKDYANFAFQRWIEKVLRREYWFESLPIKLRFTSKVEKNPYLQVNQGK